MLTRKYGPLPAWAWAAIAIGGVVVWRMRQAASSSSGSGSGSGDTTSGGATPAQDYGSGYDTGFQGGYQAGINSVYQRPPATKKPKQDVDKGSKYCRNLKAPNGHTYTVCGLGHFVREGHSYKWVHGAAPRTHRGAGAKHYPVPAPPRAVR